MCFDLKRERLLILLKQIYFRDIYPCLNILWTLVLGFKTNGWQRDVKVERVNMFVGILSLLWLKLCQKAFNLTYHCWKYFGLGEKIRYLPVLVHKKLLFYRLHVDVLDEVFGWWKTFMWYLIGKRYIHFIILFSTQKDQRSRACWMIEPGFSFQQTSVY